LEAKDIYEHMKYSTNLAIILLNIGDVYRQKGDFELSKKYYLKIVKKLKEKNNRFIEAHTFISLGTLYNDMQEYGKAKSYLAKGLEDFKAMNSSPNVINSYEQLAKCYYGMKNYEAAYQINVAMQSLKDSLNDANNQKTLLEMQTQYETTEKEKEIELLSAENEIKDLALEQEQFVKAIAIGGIVILLIIATLLLIAFGIKQKSNQMLAEKNQIINKQNEDLAHQKQNIVDSINYAKKIQDSILVEETEIAKYIDDFFIYYKPRDIVSGDFYWFSNLGDKSVIAAVDCTGHGVPGAFMSMVGNSLLNEIVNVRGITKPSEILENLHVGVYTDLQQHQDGGGAQDGMDLSLCTIHHDSKKLEFAGAMNHLIVIRDGEIQSLKADLKHIGGRPRKREKDFRRTFTNHEIDLRENDCVYMLSDGYTDQFGGEQHKKFGSKSFKQLLLKYHEMKMAQQKKIYTDFMKDWKRDFNQMDDMLLIGMKF
ncbi:MAG: tetratricopeptide repeat protein, partial [Flavobacteriales bacterium]|nr:tetratricopeptide repeat protein [Flavobacteriales bacterium]